MMEHNPATPNKWEDRPDPRNLPSKATPYMLSDGGYSQNDGKPYSSHLSKHSKPTKGKHAQIGANLVMTGHQVVEGHKKAELQNSLVSA